MKMVDVHAHLDVAWAGPGVTGVLERAQEAGLVAIVANGTGPASNRRVLELAKTYAIVVPALGVYPLDALGMADDAFDEELRFIRDQQPLAIGEIGLDFKDGRAGEEKMTRCFVALVSLARKLDLPILVHSRKAERETIEVIESLGHEKVILHCFSGKMSLVRRAVEHGWAFSIPAIARRSQHFQKVIELTPMEQLLTETDSPFLPPDPSMEQNEPAFVREGVRAIAGIKGMHEEAVADAIFSTYRKLFRKKSAED